MTGGGTRDHETSSSSSSDDDERRAATAGGLGGAAAMGQHSRGRRDIGEGGNVTNVHTDWSKERVHMTEDERRIGGPVHLAQEGARVGPVEGGVSGLEGEEEQQPGMLAKATAAAGAAVGRIRVSKAWKGKGGTFSTFVLI